MEEARVRKRLTAALLCSIVLISGAGFLSWRIGEKADTILHHIDHLEINLGLLKSYLQAQQQKEARR
jgi:hypothetical protein